MCKVLEFGGMSKEAVMAALRRIVSEQPVKIFVLPAANEESLDYQEFGGTLEAALRTLAEGRNGSVQVQSTEEGLLCAGIYRPAFANSQLEDWSASAEGRNFDAESAFDEMQSINGLTYVALFYEDSPDFNTDHITARTFPWADSRLLAGAVSTEDGEWLVRRRDNL